MKTKFYILLISTMIFAGACKSVEKLVDQGRYDEAIELATRKLAGKSKKKTKHIKSLEKAFVKVNRMNLEEISYLKNRGNGENWGQIYDYGLRIQRRQSRVRPFLPLISKDGYVGHFEMIDVRPILAESAEKMAAYLYEEGNSLLTASKSTGSKVLAQRAHDQYNRIFRYFDEYKDVVERLDESRNLGTFHVLLKMDNPVEQFELVPDWRQRNWQRDWIVFHTDHKEDITFDAISTLILDVMTISPERETVNNLLEQKEIERWVDAVDRDGNVVTDTLGNVIQVKESTFLSAQVTEIIREKEAQAIARVRTVNYLTGEIIDQDEFVHDIFFNSASCRFTGDERALSSDIRKRINTPLLPFPTDYEMVSESWVKMEDNLIRHVQRLDLTSYFEAAIVAR